MHTGATKFKKYSDPAIVFYRHMFLFKLLKKARIIFDLVLSRIGSLGSWKYWKTIHFDCLGTWKYWKTIHFDNLGTWKY